LKPKREVATQEKVRGEGIQRDITFKGREHKNFFPASKVPRQCPFVLLVELRLREGKALDSDEGKVLESELSD
jgi:hypothetical protein